MTIGDDGVASICMGQPHIGNPCIRCGNEDENRPETICPCEWFFKTASLHQEDCPIAKEANDLR